MKAAHDSNLNYSARITAIHAALGISPMYAAERGFSLHPEAAAQSLEWIATAAEGRGIELHALAAEAWRAMHAAAAADRVELVLLSGFRSVARQEELVRRKLAAGVTLAAALRVLAAPGYSEHHTGRAVDIGARGVPPLEESFEQTDAFAWLARRAREFGFHLSYPKGSSTGIAYEPWHWCWRISSR